MRYLLDTNIWLERLLNQDRADEVGQLLEEVTSDQLLMTDFSLHSVGVILYRLKQRQSLARFVNDLFVHGSVGLLTLEPTDLHRLGVAAESFNLDFDDAYQYVAADVHAVQLVSFDKDFDRTKRGRLTPEEVLRQFKTTEND
ncbi:MAG TPA: PIN domain-containing protein [Anaerolineae bacterium]|nr:type II toxin-antitoxin system VapC family toxin [Anaerolineae bacterium]MCB0004615.1 type II toxin-antitoxin system VapC family toxin [Anaerolineae bacterium]HRX05296.1 PIN domain-containing protein [Anaerolineae bacterium]